MRMAYILGRTKDDGKFGNNIVGTHAGTVKTKNPVNT